VKTALVLLPVFLGILFLGDVRIFALLIAVVAVIGAREYLELVSPGVKGREGWFVALWGAAIVLAFLAGPSSSCVGAVLCLGCLLYLGRCVLGSGPQPDTTQKWGGILGAWIFVAYFLGNGVLIRAHGTGPILFVAGTVWIGDIAAYYVGTAFGKHRLAPAVSPKKSVEGAIASLVAGALFAGTVGLVLPLPHSIPVSILLGVLLNIAAQLGDLAESLLKRCAGVKDSGTLFPGHGGVLDRLDGFLLVLPLYAHFLGLGGG
jgi:phosphatidate cytidylyltransferase